MQPNPDQPRSRFDAESARGVGAIDPRERCHSADLGAQAIGADYQIIAGERRWRASQRAGLTEVPVVVKELADADVLTVALIENIQRADLNPIEEALAYERLLAEQEFTQEALAKRVGKEQKSTITNSLRLLKLPEKVRALVVDNQLTMGHAPRASRARRRKAD